MPLPLSAAATPRLVVLESAASTNDSLAALAADPSIEHFTTVVTTNQTTGRGRSGRVWSAPPGTALAVSVVVRPQAPLDPLALGWLPLLAGVAVVRAIAPLIPEHSVSVKWPNDVLITERKVSGILSEFLPETQSVCIGAGINLEMTDEQLPVPTATSLLLAGVRERGDELLDTVLSGYLKNLRALTDPILAGETGALALAREAVLASLLTIGRTVRVDAPGGSAFAGMAIDLDESGRIVVRDAEGRDRAVTAGDVTHLRHE